MRRILTDEFREFSASLGADPLQIQGAGGNTSIKKGSILWVKASGKLLKNALDQDIFLPVDRVAALRELKGEGDGSCAAAITDPTIGLRPSIETTFHAALPWDVVAHSHSVATLVHAISPQGREAADRALTGLNPIFVPYAKPGLDLTRAILSRTKPDSRVVILQNHGLICAGNSVAGTAALIAEVERRLSLPVRDVATTRPGHDPEPGYVWAAHEGWMAVDPSVSNIIAAGSYYPDHVVFLGAGIKTTPTGAPAFQIPGEGIQIRHNASEAERAMLRCLSDIMCRTPHGWHPQAIGEAAEAQLIDWDAEKYRIVQTDRS